jgi:hypothetical protein
MLPYWVVAARMKGMAPKKSPDRHPDAPEKTVSVKRFGGVL